FPLMSLVLAVLAISCAERWPRGGRLIGGAIAVVISIAYWVVNSGALSLGRVDFLPPIVAAWTAHIVFGGIGVSVFVRTPTWDDPGRVLSARRVLGACAFDHEIIARVSAPSRPIRRSCGGGALVHFRLPRRGIATAAGSRSDDYLARRTVDACLSVLAHRNFDAGVGLVGPSSQ